MNAEFEIAYLAGGCFWCTEAVFKRVPGVLDVTPGYTGGTIKNPAYREICTGRTGHAEVIRIRFQPAIVSYRELLDLFFMTHDLTTLNRQGHDIGTQYRSAIFTVDQEQEFIALQSIKQWDKAATYSQPIVTQVVPFEVFYPAEVEHKDYFDLHPEQSYCQFVIVPKLEKLKAYLNSL